jgi:hypothetical protein
VHKGNQLPAILHQLVQPPRHQLGVQAQLLVRGREPFKLATGLLVLAQLGRLVTQLAIFLQDLAQVCQLGLGNHQFDPDILGFVLATSLPLGLAGGLGLLLAQL